MSFEKKNVFLLLSPSSSLGLFVDEAERVYRVHVVNILRSTKDHISFANEKKMANCTIQCVCSVRAARYSTPQSRFGSTIASIKIIIINEYL